MALPPESQLPRINGGRPRTNEYLFDGISVLQPEPGQVAFFPVVDAIQEFKIETNSPPAEFGRFNGGVVNLTTKAGTNALHGTAFEFLRNEALNARNYFQSADPAKPEFRRNQFGGTLGGPRARPHVLLRRLSGPAAAIGRTVDLDRADGAAAPGHLHRVDRRARAGHLRSGHDRAARTRTAVSRQHDSDDRIDSVAAALLSRYPLPTSAGTANNYRRTANEVDDQDQWDVRMDHASRRSATRSSAGCRISATFLPVTPLPEGSGVTTGTLGPQDTTRGRSPPTISTRSRANPAERAPVRRYAAQSGRRRRNSRRTPVRR